MEEPDQIFGRLVLPRIDQIAACIGKSKPLIYKWCEPTEHGSGTPNPYTRFLNVMDALIQIDPNAAGELKAHFSLWFQLRTERDSMLDTGEQFADAQKGFHLALDSLLRKRPRRTTARLLSVAATKTGRLACRLEG